MFKKTLLVSLLALAGIAHANPIGKLSAVVGNVLISSESATSSGADGSPLKDGVRVVAASGSSAVVVMNNGCRVPLAARQRVIVTTSLNCQQLVASVETIRAAAPAVAAAPAGLQTAGQSEDDDEAGALIWAGLGVVFYFLTKEDGLPKPAISNP